jgi:hypothetical protein
LTYQHNTAAMLSTSPMQDKLPFDEAVAVLENLQNQFKAGGLSRGKTTAACGST